MIKYYHKPNCSTSRNGLKLLNDITKKEVEVIEYMVDVPSQKELKEIVKMLGIKPEDLVRRKETLYKEKYADKKITGTEWIRIMSENPILIERPIIVDGNRAIIGRPVDKIVDFLKKNKTNK